MACDSVSVLPLLLVCCSLVPSLARNLDIRQITWGERGRGVACDCASLSALMLSLCLEGQIRVLYHEMGCKGSTLIHATGHEENRIRQSALHLEAELVFNDRAMPSSSLLHKEETYLLSISGAEGKSSSHSEGMRMLSHSEDMLLHEAPFVLHDDDTIRSFLAQNGLPIGLLPSSVASYYMEDDGSFTITLQQACYAKFDYEVYYARTITGKVTYGVISGLSGVKAKQGFLWLPISGVRIDTSSSEFIYCDSGPISIKLSIVQFQTIPACKVKASSALT